MRPAGCLLLPLFAILASVPTSLPGQGLSDASLEGVVVTGENVPAAGALVTLLELGTGARRQTTSSASGVYAFASVPVGTYRLEARVIGVGPATIEGIALHIGDRLRLRLVLGERIVREIDAVVVLGGVLRDPGAGGPATTVSRAAIRHLPLMNRDFVGLFSTSAQAVGPGSLWVSGQHSRFNAIQIDGTIGNDLFGTSITPGSSAGGRSLSLEALDEIRIMVAPFDVRQGGFSGGLINAVTRSGTNTRSGSALAAYSNARLVGTDSAGSSVPTFDQVQVAVTAGGPLVRNRLHYFAVGEVQTRTTAFQGFAAEDTVTGVSQATASRAASAFRERFDFDPGGPEAPDIRQPNVNLFLKLSWHPTARHSVDITQSFLRASNDNFNRERRNTPDANGWQLSNSGSKTRSAVLNTRLKSISVFGAVTNEAIAAVSVTDDRIESVHKVPLFLVQADLPNHYLAGGSVKSAQGTRTRRSSLELTDNLSWRQGSHMLTIGTQNVLFRVNDNFSLGSWGVWTFPSVTALESGSPSRYEVNLPLTERGPLAAYTAAMLSGYVQDQWRAGESLTLTAGIRADIPFFESPEANDALAANELLGRIDTGKFPTGNLVASPRIGFAWTPRFAPSSMLRGGVGAFAGRPPLVWLTGAYSGTGQEQSTLICATGNGVPAPTRDITRLPTDCLGSSQRGLPTVSYFDSRFRFHRAFKYALGLDHDFGDALLASIDLVHTTTRDNLFMQDMNLVSQGTDSEGRARYGSITAPGLASPARADPAYGPVFRYENVSGERSTSVSLSVQHSWKSGAAVQAGYGWSRTLDVMSLTGLIGPVIFASNPIDGSLARRTLRRSARDIPHTLSATLIVPTWAGTTSALFLRSRAGTPYAFTINGDANGDGERQNDLAYIPASLEDFSLTNPQTYDALDALIERKPCLRAQRGMLMKRNSCRNPPVTTLDARIAKRLGKPGARAIELSADLFNGMNLLNRRWGLVRETTAREGIPLYNLGGWDAANHRPRYFIPLRGNTPVLPNIEATVPDASRWRIQVAARFDY